MANALAELIPARIRPQAGAFGNWGSCATGAFVDFAAAGTPDAERELVSRMDSKLSLPRHHLEDVAHALRGGYAVLPALGTVEATYVTVYFDTPDGQLLRDHLRGRRPRSKLRIRHYVDRGISMLEVKTRLPSERTVKQRRPIGFGSCSLTAGDREWLAAASNIRDDLAAVAWTACRRVTLLSRERAERLTLDVGVHLGSARGVRTLDPHVIVELKQPHVDRHSPVWSALRGIGARHAGFSKFVAAMTLTLPDSTGARRALRRSCFAGDAPWRAGAS